MFSVRKKENTAHTYIVYTAIEQGGIFIVPHLLWQGASVFAMSYDSSL